MHEAEGTKESVLRAIQVLYNGPTDQQNAASAWLNNVSGTSEAWQIASELLDASNAVEVQFFAANMLYNKARRDWGRLQTTERAGLLAVVRGQLQEKAGSSHVQSVVEQRLVLVLAIMAAMEGQEAADALISNAVRIATTVTAETLLCPVFPAALLKTLFHSSPSSPVDYSFSSVLSGQGKAGMGLELLTALAEEGDALDRRRRVALIPLLIRRSPEVFGLLSQALSGHLTGGPAPYAQALKCAKVWLPLDLDGGGNSLVSPGTLLTTQPGLFGGLLNALHTNDDGAVAMAAEILSNLLGQYREGDDVMLNQRAIQEAIRSIAGLVSRTNSTEESLPEAAAAGIVSVACAVAERVPEFAVGDSEEAAALAEAVLRCLQCSSRNIAETAVEYFEMLSTVPVAQRSAAFKAPLFGRLLPSLLRHARYPQDFTTWEECIDDDSDDFHRFREHALGDVLGCAYALLRVEYLQYCGSPYTGTSAWQDKELALYAVRVVSGAVRARALQGEPISDPATQTDAQQACAFLAALFGGICTGPAPHPILANAVAQCVGDYAAWFGRAADAPLQAALQQLLLFMAVPEAALSAATAFRNLCVRCGNQLGSPAIVSSLIHAAKAALSNPGPQIEQEWQKLMVEGLARVVVILPAPEAAAAGVEIAQPIVERITQLIPQACGSPSSAAASELASRLRLLAVLVRYMEATSETQASADAPHLATRLLQLAYPALEAVASSAALQADEKVYNALCDVFQRILWAEKALAAPMLPALLSNVSGALETHRHAACLDTLSIAVAEYGSSTEHGALIKGAFLRACNAVSPLLLDGATGAAVDVRAGMYALADRYLLLSPEEFAATNTLLALGEHILPTLMAKEANAVRAALSFVLHAVSPPSPKAQQVLRGQVEQWLARGGEALVQALLFAACDTCPRHLLRMVAAPLRALLEDTGFREAAQHWIAHAATQPNLPGIAEGRLSLEDCQSFVRSGTRTPVLPVFRFGALVSDFASVARGEGTSDLLLGYEL